jgi:hypothetical protein
MVIRKELFGEHLERLAERAYRSVKELDTIQACTPVRLCAQREAQVVLGRGPVQGQTLTGSDFQYFSKHADRFVEQSDCIRPFSPDRLVV